MESWIASMLDHIGDARRRARLEPAADVHELAHARPARPPRGAARAGGPGLGRRDAHARRPRRGRAASSPATTRIRTTPTSCGSRRTTSSYERAARRRGRPVLRLPPRAARPPRRPGRDDHRVRRAHLARRRPPRPARARPGRPLRAGGAARSTPTCCATSRRRATPAACSSSGSTSGSSSPGTRSTSSSRRDRRQLWRNDLTNEEHFGVVAAEPGIAAGGRPRRRRRRVGGQRQPGDRRVATARCARCARSRTSSTSTCGCVLADDESWREHPITIGIDVRAGREPRPARPTRACSREPTSRWSSAPRTAELLQAAWWEPTRIRYGLGSGYIDVDRADMEPRQRRLGRTAADPEPAADACRRPARRGRSSCTRSRACRSAPATRCRRLRRSARSWPPEDRWSRCGCRGRCWASPTRRA